VQITRIWSR